MIDDLEFRRLRGRVGGLTTVARYGGAALSQKGVAAKKRRWAETGDPDAACRAEMAKLQLRKMQLRAERQQAAHQAPMSVMSMPGKRVCPDCCFRQMKPFPINAIPRRCKRHANIAA